ncbi:MAG: DUF3068 domain-containing protein [Micrococcales bacterium]|nr:DUF3068 domain-containing protein [Micrococcales bacterium]
MKRILGLLAFGLGVLLLVMAPVIKFAVAPGLLKAPVDLDVTLPHGGENFTYLSAKDGGEIVLPYVSVSRHIRTNTDLSNDKVAVYEQALCLSRSDDKAQLPCTTGSDDRTIANYYRSFAFDRKTGMAVNGNVCGSDGKTDCKNTYNDKPVTREGVGSIFPMGTEKKDYLVWDDPSGKAWPAKFSGVEKIEGLETYKFVQTITDAPADTKGLPSLYSNTRTLWVEPRTGATIHGQEELDQRLTGEEPGKSGLNPQLENKTALKGTLAFLPEANKIQADKAREGIKSIDMITKWLPLALLVLGALLALLGYLLSRRGRDDDDQRAARRTVGPDESRERVVRSGSAGASAPTERMEPAVDRRGRDLDGR